MRTYAFPRIGDKTVDKVTTADIMAVLSPIWSVKRVTAKRVRQRIGAVMKWAIAQGLRMDNPAGDAISAALPKIPAVNDADVNDQVERWLRDVANVRQHGTTGERPRDRFAHDGVYVGGSLKQTLHTMFFSPKHSFAGNLEFMRLLGMLRKRAKDLDFEDHSRMLDLDTGESFAEFARANSLTRYLKQAGELDLNCFTAAGSDQVGAAYGMSLLWLWTVNPATRSYLPRQGIGALAEALEKACASLVQVSTPVDRIVVEDGRARGVVTSSGERIDADAVICATTASSAAKIIPELPGDLRTVLERVSYSSCCYVAFGLETNILADGSHAALFPPESPTFLTMVTNLAATTPDAAPSGKTIIHALIIGEHARSLFSLDDDEVVRLVLEEMRRFFPGMPERPLLARVYRWPEAFCLSPGGMLTDMQDMRVQLNRCLGGLFLAGDYTHLPSLNGAMRSGVGAAEASLSYVGSA